jgi:hypothetical protein
VATDELKQRKQKLKEGIEKLKMMLLVAKNDRERFSLKKSIDGLEKKLAILSKS